MRRWLFRNGCCNCGTLTCWLDALQHRLRVGGFSDRICDRHDAWIRRNPRPSPATEGDTK